jgi:hypothetical protein
MKKCEFRLFFYHSVFSKKAIRDTYMVQLHSKIIQTMYFCAVFCTIIHTGL